MNLTFENSVGKISMNKKEDPWKITSIKGLGNVNKSYNSVTYVGYEGHKTISSTANSRIITIGGDIKSENLKDVLSFAARVFDEGVKMVIESKDMKRAIFCERVIFEERERNLKFVKFSLQLICDNPYFQDVEIIENGVFDRLGLIASPFTLPCKFSTRSNQTIIKNLGDRKVTPVFVINNMKIDGTAPSTNYGYLISNETTGQKIQLRYKSVLNEIIKINIPERTITSSVKGNIITSMTDDTFLDEFWFERGDNIISVTNYNTNEELRIVCYHNNSYVEAVF